MTTERKIYRNAPITEALIDLRVTHADDFSVKDLMAIGEAIADLYPAQAAMHHYSGEWSVKAVGDPMFTEITPQLKGFQFSDQKNWQRIQARSDGFTFSVSAPYDRWEPFRDEARRLWELYRSAAKVERITRAAVRYINRIDIPGARTELEDYFRIYPEVSADMPNEGLIGGFFMQLQLWQEDLNCLVLINETLLPPLDHETTSIQLDLDLFREQFGEPWEADDDARVWDFLEQLHDRKNEVFEASITDATRRLIS